MTKMTLTSRFLRDVPMIWTKTDEATASSASIVATVMLSDSVLSKKVWHSDSCRERFPKLADNIQKLLYALRKLNASRDLTAEEILKKQELQYFGKQSLMYITIKGLHHIINCLKEYENHLEEGCMLVKRLKGTLANLKSKQLHMSLSYLHHFLNKTQTAKNNYYQGKTSKVEMLFNTFSSATKRDITITIQGKWGIVFFLGITLNEILLFLNITDSIVLALLRGRIFLSCLFEYFL